MRVVHKNMPHFPQQKWLMLELPPKFRSQIISLGKLRDTVVTIGEKSLYMRGLKPTKCRYKAQFGTMTYVAYVYLSSNGRYLFCFGDTVIGLFDIYSRYSYFITYFLRRR